MGWHAALRLDYASERGRTVARHRHDGPMRVLKALYPEGDAVCHHVLVHPPSGFVGGDRVELELELGRGAHALVTTPGASRFYRSGGAEAVQCVRAHVGAGARLEWLPLENIAYRGAEVVNAQRFALEPGGEMFGWDLLALGLPASDAPFDAGRVHQRLEVAGAWLEAGTVRADDRLLLDSPLGFAGRRALATLWWACGAPIEAARAQAALDAARGCAAGLAPVEAGATQPDARVVVVRALAERIEPLATLMRSIRAAWRTLLWGLPAPAPRVWSA